MIKCLVCVERIGGQSGKRFVCHIVKDCYKDWLGNYAIDMQEVTNTLYVEPSFIEDIMAILQRNAQREIKGKQREGRIEVYGDYVLLNIFIKGDQIVALEPIKTENCLKNAQ